MRSQNDQPQVARKGPAAQDFSQRPSERAALVRLPFEALAELLQLPLGARIDAALADLTEDRMLTIRIRDAGWPTTEGHKIPWATASVTEYRDVDGRCFKRVIEWDMPLNV